MRDQNSPDQIRPDQIEPDEPPSSGTPFEVLAAFLKLGLTSFGGPVAHIGYYRLEFVEKRRWLSESQFAQLLAICQFLPGPASSQFGFSVGLLRAGWLGAIAAFVAFTLPSGLLLFGFAALLPYLSGDIGTAAIHGLKIVALAFVTHAVFSMNRQLCPDPARQTLAVLAAATVLVAGTVQIQFLVILLGAVAGLFVSPREKTLAGASLEPRYGMTTGWALLAIFATLLVVVMTLPDSSDDLLTVFGAFYQAGALVFGGGHVVLPLLEETVVAPGWISAEDFLAGYGAAQAVPGPLFSVAAYLGAQLPGSSGGLSGAALATLAIFLPGFLLVAGVLPLWRFVSERPGATRAIAGANSAVVGLLAAALYDPVFTSAVQGPTDFAIGLIAILLLGAWRRSPLIIVAWCVLASIAAASLQQI
jgi:chromate transporter